MSHEPQHRDHKTQGSPATAAYADTPMAAARAPVGTGTTPLYAQLIALALVALGVVAIRDALLDGGAFSGSSWTQAALDGLDGIEPAAWMTPIFVVLILLGVALLVPVLKRRPRKALALNSETGVFLRTHDLARIAREATQDVDGVVTVHASASRRSVNVNATTITSRDHNSATEGDIRQRLEAKLGALERPPRLKIKIRNEGDDR